MVTLDFHQVDKTAKLVNWEKHNQFKKLSETYAAQHVLDNRLFHISREIGCNVQEKIQNLWYNQWNENIVWKYKSHLVSTFGYVKSKLKCVCGVKFCIQNLKTTYHVWSLGTRPGLIFFGPDIKHESIGIDTPYKLLKFKSVSTSFWQQYSGTAKVFYLSNTYQI